MSTFPKVGFIPSLRGKGGSCCGRKGMPAAWIEQMYADYLRLGSLAKVGALHGRTRQNMFEIFKRRELKLNEKKFLTAVVVDGVKYTEQKTQGRHRYLRATVRKGKTLYLHHVVWEQHHGPIPPGHRVCFKDGNHRNVAIDNLELLSNSEQVRKYAAKGENGATKSARARLSVMLARHRQKISIQRWERTGKKLAATFLEQFNAGGSAPILVSARKIFKQEILDATNQRRRKS